MMHDLHRGKPVCRVCCFVQVNCRRSRCACFRCVLNLLLLLFLLLLPLLVCLPHCVPYSYNIPFCICRPLSLASFPSIPMLFCLRLHLPHSFHYYVPYLVQFIAFRSFFFILRPSACVASGDVVVSPPSSPCPFPSPLLFFLSAAPLFFAFAGVTSANGPIFSHPSCPGSSLIPRFAIASSLAAVHAFLHALGYGPTSFAFMNCAFLWPSLLYAPSPFISVCCYV